MTTTDWRELCAEILTAYRTALYDDDLVLRARAALAQPEPEVVGPTDEELLGEWGKAVINLPGDSWSSTALAFARAVLAHWGNLKAGITSCAPAPAEGEVAELVEFLRIYGDEVMDEYGDVGEHDQLTRAAALLEQRYPTPVPVAERLPGPGDCDAEGRCWLFSKVEKEWRLIDAGNPGVPHLKYCFSHWLPATALPLPAGEVQP